MSNFPNGSAQNLQATSNTVADTNCKLCEFKIRQKRPPFCHVKLYPLKNSPTGNRTPVSRVRVLYPNQLDYRGVEMHKPGLTCMLAFVTPSCLFVSEMTLIDGIIKNVHDGTVALRMVQRMDGLLVQIDVLALTSSAGVVVYVHLEIYRV